MANFYTTADGKAILDISVQKPMVDGTDKTNSGIKLFKLSDNPPVNIMINGSPTIHNFPLELLIHEFEKTSSELSDEISKDLKKRGMKFVGTTIIYSYLQAIGIINSHEPQCFLNKKYKED